MEFIAKFFGAILDGFKIEFTIYGFTFSFWDVFIWTALAALLISAILDIFDN